MRLGPWTTYCGCFCESIFFYKNRSLYQCFPLSKLKVGEIESKVCVVLIFLLGKNMTDAKIKVKNDGFVSGLWYPETIHGRLWGSWFLKVSAIPATLNRKCCWMVFIFSRLFGIISCLSNIRDCYLRFSGKFLVLSPLSPLKPPYPRFSRESSVGLLVWVVVSVSVSNWVSLILRTIFKEFLNQF